MERVLAAVRRSGPAALTLGAVAVAQPVLDLFGRNPEFFVARDASTTDIVVFGLLAALGAPVAALAIVAVAAAVSERAAVVTHRAVVFVLAGLFALVLINGFGGAGVTVLAFAVAAGVLVTVGERRFDGLRSGLRYLSPLPVLVLALFLFGSETSRLIWSPAASAAPAQEVASPAPVALVVFDELPIASLMDRDGEINAERFPNFARLADAGTWHRNATSPYARTEAAVPAALTGVRSPLGSIPSTIDHPRNLFTLLADTYEMNVVEEVTGLCPEDICDGGSESEDGASTVASARAALADAAVVYGHQAVPSPWSDDLPVVNRSWGGFADAGRQTDPFEARRDDPAGTHTQVGKVAFADEMIDGLRGDNTLNMAHVVFPHAPWTLTPSGDQYGATMDGIEFDPKIRWDDDEDLVRQGQMMHLWQVGYADAVLGRMLDAVEATGQWDETLIAVAADHGAAFEPGGLQREPTADNLDEILRVPLLIKAPHQDTPEVDDRPAQLTDLVPTIVDQLDVRTDWAFDGVPLTADGPRPDPVAVLPDHDDPVALDPTVGPLHDLARRNAGRFPHDDGWAGVVAVGAGGAHVGEAEASLAISDPAGWSWASPQQDAYADVERSSGFVPAQLQGMVSGPSGAGRPEEVLVSVNGTVAGVGVGLEPAGPDTWSFSALLSEESFVTGPNRVSILVPDSRGGFFPASSAQGRGFDRLTGSGSSREVRAEDGDVLPVSEPSDTERLEVDRAFTDGQSVVIEGLAVEDRRDLPVDVVLFVDGRAVSTGANPYPVLNEGGAELERWGFELVVAEQRVDGASDGQLVAVFADDAVALDVAWE